MEISSVSIAPSQWAVSNNETRADDLVEPVTKTGSIKISFLYGLFFTSSVSLSWRGVDCDWGLQQTSSCWNLPKLTSFFLICCVQMNNDIYSCNCVYAVHLYVDKISMWKMCVTVILLAKKKHIYTLFSCNVCKQMQQSYYTDPAAICESTLWYSQSCCLCHSITKNRL